MQKLFNADLLDLFTVEDGFVYSCKETLPDGKEAVAFYTYNQTTEKYTRIPVSAYINYKYGENQYAVARILGDFVTCNVVSLTSNTRVAAYPDGRIKVLGTAGEIISEAKVEYLDNPACSPAVNGADLWFAVPDSNAVINYSVKHNRTEFRIGSTKDKTFCHPCDIAIYDNKLFICNAYSYKIRTIDLANYQVADYCLFNEPVRKYFRVKDTEYVIMPSGVFSL